MDLKKSENVSFNKCFDLNADEILLKVETPMFETLEVLKNSRRFKNNSAFAQYMELCYQINFTEIADLTYLFTHYGVVTEESLRASVSEKETTSLMVRHSMSSNFLAEYGSKSLTNDDILANKKPFTMKDRSAWYSRFKTYLSDAFSEIKLTIDLLHKRLIYTDRETKTRRSIDDYSPVSFVKFLQIVLHTSKIFDIQSDWTEDLLTRFVNDLEKDDDFSLSSINNSIIQFDDCYVKDGRFIEGDYPFVARFYIHWPVYDVVKNLKTSLACKEIDEFILHLCDYDQETVPVFLSRMSTFLMNRQSLKTNLAATINILYGASGANGKSLFLSILKKIFEQEDVTLASLREFNNRTYQLPKMCQSLLVIDEDSADLQLDHDAVANLKMFSHGQPMEVRSIYEKSRIYHPSAMIVACTNHMPTSVDKSDAFNRRFSIFTQNSKLVSREHVRSEEWFNSLRSDDSAKYLLDLLILAHLDNMSRGSLMKISSRMKEINEDFVEKNDSAVMYIRAIGLKEIVGKPVKLVKERYESWCETNGVTALKNKFNTTLESKFGLIARNMTLKNLTIDESDLTVIGMSDRRQIRSWVCRDQDVYQKYLDLNTEEAEDLYTLDANQNIKDLSKEIIDSLKSSDSVENSTVDEILRKISILMDDQTEDKIASVSEKVERSLVSSYDTEDLLVSKMSKSDYDRYISIAKNNDALLSALSDPNRRVVIFRNKKSKNK
jgi:hypothetical protein